MDYAAKLQLFTLFRYFSTLYVDLRDRSIRETDIYNYGNKLTDLESAAWDHVKTLKYEASDRSNGL